MISRILICIIMFSICFELSAKMNKDTGVKYLKEMLDLGNEDAKAYHKELLGYAKKFSFFECPIKLIEYQYNGPESVLRGAEILQMFLDEARMPDPNYKQILKYCEGILHGFKKDKKKRRKIYNVEDQELHRQLDNLRINKKKLDNLEEITQIIDVSYNKVTKCYFKRPNLKLGVGVTASVGISYLDCYSPLGRRFRLEGPSVGVGVGAIAAISFPYSKKHNDKLSIVIPHFIEKDHKYWFGNVGFEADLGHGVAINLNQEIWHEDWLKGPRPKKTFYDAYTRERKVHVGLGLTTEYHYNFVHKKKWQPPLFIILDKILNLSTIGFVFNDVDSKLTKISQTKQQQAQAKRMSKEALITQQTLRQTAQQN